MLKLTNVDNKNEARITLFEDWHEKIIQFSQFPAFPYEFIIEEIVKDKLTKQTYYLCASVKSKNNKTFKLALTKNVVNYLFAQEVPDQNIGLSFKEYLPEENSQILITNSRNPNEVVPGIFKADINLIELNGKSILCLDFKIYYINGDGFTSINYYSCGNRKYEWKFLFHEDISYMTDYEKMFRDTLIHKSFVRKSCEILARYLEKEGASNHAKMLRQRAIVHDNSKIENSDELNALSRIINDKTCLTNASSQLSTIKQDAIKLHWKHNTHHPEFFKSMEDMSRLDIMEMCCDWHARSSQYKTDFLSFVETRQKDRFHFPEWMYAEIMHYCKILASSI